MKPVEVQVQPYFRKHFGEKYTCGKCNYELQRKWNYCPKCGEKIEWR